MYESEPTTFEEMIAPFPGRIREIADWLRGCIRESFPELDEGIHGGRKVAMALYGVGGQERIALGIQPASDHVKLYVHDPEHLPAEPFRLEGTGQHMRHIKLRTPPEDRREDLVTLMRIPVERRS